MKQRISSVFLALVILLSMLPSTVFAAQDTPASFSAEVVDSGTCGENLTWTLDNSGTLTISGEGRIENYYSDSDRPWDGKKESIKRVVIENGVTSIGWSAFNECTSLTSVTISDSVTEIRRSAFAGCTSLTKVHIPAGLVTLSSYAFDGCTSLTEFTVAEENVNYTAAEGVLFSKDMTRIILCPVGKSGRYVIPNSVTSIEDWAFYGCTGLTSVTIPDSVTSIEEYAFYGCTGLISATIPDSVTNVGNGAFSGCTGLTSITIPNSVTSIEDWTFSDCTGLTSVTIPDSVTEIGEGTFDDCTGLTSVTIPDSVTSIGSWAFADCTSLTSVAIPNSVTSIEDGTFARCTSLTSVTIPDSVTEIGWSVFSGCTSLASVEIPNGVTAIEWYAFLRCTSLTSVTIPDSVTEIGCGTFSDCTSLASVTIPNSVTSIEWYAFDGCTGLTSVTIPDSVTYIGYEAFSNCSKLKNVKLPSKISEIDHNVFSGCETLEKVEIPDGVTDIKREAFSGCTSLTSVMIPASVTAIGYKAFSNCSKLKDVYYKGTDKQWGTIEISDGNNSLTSATIHYSGDSKPAAPAAPAVKPDYLLSTGKPYLKWKAVDGAVKYYVYRSGSKSGTYKLLGTTTKTNYTDTTASAGYTYYYKVKTVNASGVKSSYSAAVSAISHCAKPTVKAEYTVSSGKPYLKWSTVTGASKYQVYRAGSQNGTYKLLGTTTKTNYTDTTASAGYTYYYKVKAVSKVKTAANSAYSAVVKAVSHCARPMVKPDYLASTGKPYLKWSAVTGASKYEVYRAGSQNGTYKYIGSTTKTGYTDTTASAGYAYYYKVKAVSKVKTAANSAYSTVVKATCHCAKPVVKITTSSGKPKLTWNAVAGAGKYEVYRATSKNGTYTKMFTTTNRSYTNTNAKAGTTYYYKIKAVSKVKTAANSAYSAVKSIRAR